MVGPKPRLAALVCFLVGLAEVPAVGDPPARRILVMGSTLGEGEAALTAIEMEDVAREAASFVLGRDVAARDQDSAELDARVRGCTSNASCVARVLANLRASELVWLVLDTGEPCLLTGKLVRADGTLQATAVLQVSAAELRRTQVAELATDLLRRSGFALGGRIHLELRPSDASVDLIALTGSTSDTTALLPVGKYALHARADGFLPFQDQVEIKPASITRLSVVLEPEPSVFSSPWVWVAIGAAALAGTATAFVLLRPRGRELCIPGDVPECQ